MFQDFFYSGFNGRNPFYVFELIKNKIAAFFYNCVDRQFRFIKFLYGFVDLIPQFYFCYYRQFKQRKIVGNFALRLALGAVAADRFVDRGLRSRHRACRVVLVVA